MKFKNRIGPYFILMSLCTILICVTAIVLIWIRKPSQPPMLIWVSLLLLATVLLMIWLWTGTSYEIDLKFLSYKSGPVRGKVKIENIRELVVGKTLWTGIKPATAIRGITVRYNLNDEIYISPISNEHFVREILKVNPNIKIIRSR